MLIFMQQTLMQFLLWLLRFIDGVFSVFGVVAGINEVQTPSGDDVSLGQYFLELPAVQKAFWVVVIASVGICAVCAVAAIVKAMINAKGGEPKSPIKTAGQAASTVVVTLLMSIFMITGVWAADGLLKTVDEGMNGSSSLCMGVEIINIAVEESYEYDDNNILKLNEYDDDGNCTYKSIMYRYVPSEKTKEINGVEYAEPATFDDNPKCIKFYKTYDEKTGASTPFDNWSDIYREKYDQNGDPIPGEYILDTSKLVPVKRPNAGWLKVNEDDPNAQPKDILKTENGMIAESVESLFGTHNTAILPTTWKNNGKIAPDSFNFLVAYLCALIILIALVAATLGLVKRLFDLVLLFISLPGIVATIPLDDGAKFKLWRETVVSKVFLAFGSVFAVNVFFIVAPSIWGISVAGAPFINSILRLVLICGGALTISGGQLLFSRLLGTSAEESREMGQSARTLLGGTSPAFGLSKGAGRFLFGIKNANGQRVGGAIKGSAGAIGAIGGGAVNFVGTLAGGSDYRNSKLAARNTAVQNALRGFAGSSGWFGKDKITGENTVFGALGSRMSGKLKNVGKEHGVFGKTTQVDKMRRTSQAMKAATDNSRAERPLWDK